MTERWRKKLGDLDKQGPSEDVFERAKEGPMHVDEPLPPVRTSTRMLTVVAAFAVFALGISVFAVPALRMGGEAGGQPSGTLPLWPARTADDLHALQAAADAGQADWALDPKQLAGRFVGEVMGWNDPYVVPAPVSDCGQGAPSSAALVSGNAPGAYSLPGASWTEGCASFPYPNVSSLARGSNEMTASISASFGYRTFAVVPCKPLAPGCGDYAVGPTELVSVYQPLRQGVGQIWGVLQARSPQTIDLPMVPGQNVRSGSTVSASVVTGGAHPTIAYTSCGQSAGQEIPQMHLLKNEASLDVSLSPSATCSGPQAGYVWAATAKTRLAGEDGSITVDPLTDTGQYLYSLSAVPVTMLFPDHEGFASSSSTDMSAPPSTVDPVTWTPFTDPLGWMIDVPTTWQSRSIDASSPTGFGGSGTEFFGGGIEVDLFRDEALAPPPADDSTFPLDPNDLGDFEGGVQLVFRGNGSRYQLLVPGIPAADLDVQQQEIVDHMVASISFEPWTVGERRQEWTAFGRVLPSASAQWIEFDGEHYVASLSGDRRKVLGPAPSCSNGGATYEVRESGVAGISCADGSGGDGTSPRERRNEGTLQASIRSSGTRTPFSRGTAICSSARRSSSRSVGERSRTCHGRQAGETIHGRPRFNTLVLPAASSITMSLSVPSVSSCLMKARLRPSGDHVGERSAVRHGSSQ